MSSSNFFQGGNDVDDTADDNQSHHSFPSIHSHVSHNSQLSQNNNNNNMSTPTGNDYHNDRNSNTSFPSAGSTFFADMTLDDIHDAQMESTPRSEMKFAAMATKGSGSGNGGSGSSGRLNNREEILQNVPAMPLVEEPSFDDDDDEAVVVTDEQQVHQNHHLSPVVENQDEERVFTRITSSRNNNTNNINSSDNNATSSILSLRQRLQQHRHRSNHNNTGRPYPRDLQWTTAFCTLLPIGLFIPHFYYSNHYIEHHNKCEFHPTLLEDKCTPLHSSLSSMALSTASHSTILFATFSATLLSIGILQLLYLHPGGGDGDDIRHTNVTRTLLLSANVSVWMDIILGFMMWVWLPNARGMVVIPFSLLVRDVWWRMRKTGSALPSFRRRGGVGGGVSGSSRGDGRSSNRGGAGTSVTSSHDRKTFFRALACAALDILSRSLRRKSFVRVASIILVTQFIVVSIWWGTISVILSVEIFTEDGVFTKFMHRVWLLAALVAGKWATGTVARLLGKFDSRSSHTIKVSIVLFSSLSLTLSNTHTILLFSLFPGFVASGGVTSWFAQQTVMIEEMRVRQQQQQQEEEAVGSVVPSNDDNQESAFGQHGDATTSSDYNANYAAARAARHAMPEAYRMADAAAYSSAMNFDDGLDDDYEDDDEDFDFGGPGSSAHSSPTSSTSTVKSFLLAGCTFSFGSVAQCGLVGGLAQILWSVVRNIDAAGFFLQRRFPNRAMQRMDISINSGGVGSGGGGLPINSRQWKQTLAYWWRRLDVAIRGFVRSHSDLAMSHVAAYYKTYQRAANDVAALIETSGVESIIHDDITTQMCSVLGHVLSGSIVIVFGTLLATHQNTFASEPLSDYSLFEILFASYFLCYSIIFTALEPLRAAIKAVYVCFAEHPLSLSQAFPLIFQRLSRISEASSSVV